MDREKTHRVSEVAKVEEKLQRVNLILRTIRKVDQVILEERFRERLIERVCKNLVMTRGYYNAWVALMDVSGKFYAFAQAGLGKKFLPMQKKLQAEGATDCGRKALARKNAVVVYDPAGSCIDCPLANKYMGRGGITVRLKYREKIFGLLCASIPVGLTTEEEERSLFEDIARDLAFALHKIEVEEEHDRSEEALRASENRYRALFDSASDGMVVRDLEGNIIMANNAMGKLTGFTIDELESMNISSFLSPESFKKTMSSQKMRLEGKSEDKTDRYELQMVKKNGEEITIESVTSLLFGGERLPVIQAIVRDVSQQKQARKDLRDYAGQAILAQEEERKRVARELHDETAQALASLGMDIDSLAKKRMMDSVECSKRLEELRDRTSDILKGVRSLSQAMRPPMLEEVGLLAALQGIANELARQQAITVNFEVKGIPQRLSPDIELTLFRIAQEASTNISKHSRATKCMFQLLFRPEKIQLRISDNGQGFEGSTTEDESTYSGKLGLIGMRERAKLVGGFLTILSKPGKGTTVVFEILQRKTK
jgi:two-component system, NarL family, sensor histidine kinase DegS